MKKILAILCLVMVHSVAYAQTIMNDLIGLGMKPELADYIASNVVAGGAVLGNNTYFTGRNQANSANIDILKLTTGDDLLFNADSGDFIRFQIDSDANRIPLTLDASSDTALTAQFGDGGTTAVQQLLISASTSDADDDSTLILAGGGADGGTRGASITLPGEEVSGGGDITYNAGTADNHIFNVAGVNVLQIDATGVTQPLAKDFNFNVGLGTIALQEAVAGTKCMGGGTHNGTTAVTVSTTCATTGSRVLVTDTSDPTGSTAAQCWVTNIVNGTSFDVDCDQANDASFNWFILHEAP